MINSLESYQEAGKRAAVAMNQSDIARHNFERSWFIRARGLEQPADRPTASAAFDRAYAAHRKIIKPDYYT
jgi:hypothetical protein